MNNIKKTLMPIPLTVRIILNYIGKVRRLAGERKRLC